MSFFGGGRGGPYRPRGNNQSNMRFGLLPLVRPTFNNNRGNFRGGGRGQRSHQGGLGTRRNQPFRFQNNMPPRNNASPRQVAPRQQVTPRPGQIVRLGPSKPVPPKTDAKVETKVETEVDKQKDVAKLESKQEVKTDNNQEKNEKEKPKAEEKGKVVTDKVTTAPVQEIKTEKRIVTLDRHNCELHMVTDKSLLVAENMRGDGFQYMWAGARANFGVKTGKNLFFVFGMS